MVLDEAHTIKSSKSHISMAAATLVAERRWCLTGTPIQVIYFVNIFISILGFNICKLDSECIMGMNILPLSSVSELNHLKPC